MRARILLVLALAATPVISAWGDERPLTKPSRDVDVVYRMMQPAGPGRARVLEQRMRWAVADGKLRVDPPAKGLYLIMDMRTHRVATVRVSERVVLEIGSSQAAMEPGAAGARFARRGDDHVAGLPCTEWETKDTMGEDTLVCLTPDGVMLRAAAAGHVLLEAASVTYGAQDPAVFMIPEGYTKVAPK